MNELWLNGLRSLPLVLALPVHSVTASLVEYPKPVYITAASAALENNITFLFSSSCSRLPPKLVASS